MATGSRSYRANNQELHHPKVGEIVEKGMLREYSDPAAGPSGSGTARQAIEQFLSARAKDLKTDSLDLREERADRGKSVLRIRYRQYLHGLPVLGAGIHATANIAKASVTRIDNTADIELGDAPDPRRAMTLEEVMPAALAPFGEAFGAAKIIESTLAYLRDRVDDRPPIPACDYPTASAALLSTGTGPDGELHLVHEILIETDKPYEKFRVLVDAISGKVLFLELVGRYVAATGMVFMPDPVSESDSGTLSSLSTAAQLDGFRHAVTMEVKQAADGTFLLEGPWFRSVDWDLPTFDVPVEATPDFSYQSPPADWRFLAVNAYYWLDSFARYLRTLGNPTLNTNMTQVEIDAQGNAGTDNSQWMSGTPNRIRYGTGGVPDAADFGVIIHEYLHGVFHFLNSNHGGLDSYEHSFCDAIAAVYRDQHNPSRHRRTETFPFDNNATDRWSNVRTLDRVERFDDAALVTYLADLRASMLGTVIWNFYAGIGGDSDNPVTRQRACDVVITTFMETLLCVPNSTSTSVGHARVLAQGMIDADIALTGGLHSKVIHAAAVKQGLWPARAVDLWIADSPADAGAIPSLTPHWTSPDSRERNAGPASGDDPTGGHQEPIVGQPNYMYVTIHNRGSAASTAGVFSVEAFHCDPGTGMIWPTHFTSMGTLAIATAIPAGGAVQVGPFLWTPAVVGHECLLAIVHGADDPSVAANLTGAVPHDQLVRFDNNVGQRNVAPQLAVAGGGLKVSMTIHGGLRRGANVVEVDASALPPDTSIDVQMLTRLIKTGKLTQIAVSKARSLRSTMTMAGGVVAKISEFVLASRQNVLVDLAVTLSRHAEHLKTYPLIVTQYRDGEVVGRMSFDIVAIAKLENYYFGNPRSREVHAADCPCWPRLGPYGKRPFPRIEDAIARGYSGCAICLPNAGTG